MKLYLVFLLCMSGLILKGEERANDIVIDFDQIVGGSVVNTIYPGVTFSMMPVGDIFAYSISAGTSFPNVICTLDCTGPISVDFSPGVDNLTFQISELNFTSVEVHVFVYEDENVISSGFFEVFGTGNPSLPYFVDLTAFMNVTRVEIINVTAGNDGIVLDDFSFSQPCVGLENLPIEEWPDTTIISLVTLLNQLCSF